MSTGWRKRQISDLIECQRMLEMLFPKQPELIDGWWRSPNKAFDMKPPREVFNTGGGDRVSAYLRSHLGGEYY